MVGNKFQHILASTTLITLMVFSGFESVYAACPIASGPAPVLTKYSSDLEKFRAEIKKIINESKCEARSGATWDIKNGTDSVLAAMNRATPVNSTLSIGEFWIGMALKSEIPYAINRDYQSLLQPYSKILASDLDLAAARCALDATITSNVSPDISYNTQGKPVGKVLSDLLSNHNIILNLYRETVAGITPVETDLPFLVPSTFLVDLENAYGPNAVAVCQKDEWSLWTRVSEAISKIGSMGGSIQTGMQSWSDAWALLKGTNKDQQRIERDLLSKELGRQWVSADASARTLRNLAEYNSTGKYQGINGFVENLGATMQKALAELNEVYEEARALIRQSKNSDQYVNRMDRARLLQSDIGKEILSDYERNRELMGREVLSLDDNLGQLVQIHLSLKKWNDNLLPYVKIAREACGHQNPSIPCPK